jgi:hypothetical protein
MNWIRRVIKALARRARPSIIDRFTIGIGLDVDHSGLDEMAARTEELHARWTDISAMVQAGKPFGITPGSSIVRLDVGAGDVLVHSVPTVLNSEQRARMVEQIGLVFSAGPRVLVLDGGMTISRIVRCELPEPTEPPIKTSV